MSIYFEYMDSTGSTDSLDSGCFAGLLLPFCLNINLPAGATSTRLLDLLRSLPRSILLCQFLLPNEYPPHSSRHRREINVHVCRSTCAGSPSSTSDCIIEVSNTCPTFDSLGRCPITKNIIRSQRGGNLDGMATLGDGGGGGA